MALFLASSWVKEMCLSKVLFISDCLQLVNFVNGNNCVIDRRCLDRLEDFRSSFSACLGFKLGYVNRTKNKVVDKLSRRARMSNLKTIWDAPPPFLDVVMELCRKIP